MNGSLTTEVVNLSNGSHCLLVDLHPGPRILVDCPLDPLSLTFFPVRRSNGLFDESANVHPGFAGVTPIQTAELGIVDPSTVDCILLTNFHNILALPLFTEGDIPFDGVILATEPTAQLGKLLMEELSSFVHAASSSSMDASHRQQGQKSMYTKEQIEKCVSRIRRLNFGQGKEIQGGVVCTPVPSAYCLGGANWHIQSATHRVALVGASSMSPAIRHPRALNYQSLSHVDVAIIGDLIPREREYPSSTPGTATAATQDMTHWPINDICSGVGQTLARGGNVLLPAQPCGTVLDLIHALGTHLARADMHLTHTHMYFISPVGENIMGYLEILAEWVNTSRRDRVYIPESPFLHNDFQQSGRLHIVSEVYELSGKAYVEPCVVIAGHPCLRFGPALHFLKRWGSNPENAVILTDPFWNRFPRSDSSTITCYDNCLSSAFITSPPQSIPAMMDVDLACKVRVKPVGDVPAASLACRLKERDGRLTLSLADQGDLHLSQKVVLGTLSAPSLVAALVRRSVDDCEVLPGEADDVLFTVRSVSLGAEVQIKANSCSVITGPKVRGNIKMEKMEEEDDDDSEKWANRAQTVHEAVMEQLVVV